MMRRLLGILLVASMAHLVTAGADTSCESAKPDHSAMAGMHHHAGAPAEKAPCKVPAHSDCCAAAMTCSVSVSSSSPLARERSIALHADAPRHALVPPDPPPPKA